MNKRAKKKVEKRRRALAHQILDIVLDINGLEERRVSVSGNNRQRVLTLPGTLAGFLLAFMIPDILMESARVSTNGGITIAQGVLGAC